MASKKPTPQGVSGLRVRVDRQRGDTTAQCQDKCQWWALYMRKPCGVEALTSAFSAAEVRVAARRHVAETGHVVEVTVQDVTRYEPAEVRSG